MQYLLTEDEYKNLADVNAKARQIAEAVAKDYRNRLCEELIKVLDSGMYYSLDRARYLTVIRNMFSKVELKFDV